jgi:hypothetical protein
LPVSSRQVSASTTPFTGSETLPSKSRTAFVVAGPNCPSIVTA